MGSFGLVYFCGELFACLFIMRITDQKGRIMLLRLFLAIEVGAYSVILFVHNYYWRLAMLFVNGIGMGVVTSASYMLALESIPERFSEFAGGTILIIDSMTLLIASLILMFFTRNTEYIQLLGLVIAAISLLASFAVLESPKYLHSVGKYQRARSVVLKIARRNRRKIEDFHFKEEEVSP